MCACEAASETERPHSFSALHATCVTRILVPVPGASSPCSNMPRGVLDLEAPTSRPVGRSRIPMIALLLASLSGVLVFAIGVAPSDVACATCHRAATMSRAETAHVSVDCSACHARSGSTGWLEARSFEIGFMYPAAIGLPVSGSGPGAVASDRCLGCHAGVRTQMAEVAGIRMRHETCIAPGVRCVDCHQDVGHGPVTGRVLGATMGDCTGCHDGRTASAACETCHVEGTDERAQGVTIWRITHGENWQSTHGMGDLTTCKACHAAGDCSACHYDQPHPDNWPAVHGVRALEAASITDACLGCHKRAYCQSCHLVEMPHPDDWLPRHLKETEGYEDERCTRCHGKQDCTTCHEMHAHPGRIDLGDRR